MNELRNQLAEEFQDPEYAHAYLEENSNMRIAAQIRALRLQRNWSQNDLAARAGMRQARISKIESADFDSLSLNTLRRLAIAFDVALSVKFDSVLNVVNDFMQLSKDKLLCETRVTSIEKMGLNPAGAITVPATQNLSVMRPIIAASSSSNNVLPISF